MPYYTGIGSRSTPPGVQASMTELAALLRGRGWRLRSGAAEGADQAFGRGAGAMADIYVPWRGFGYAERGARVVALDPNYLLDDDHMRCLKLGCPHVDRLSQGAHKLHARNCYQVLGDSLSDPSEFVVCWTPGGQVQGGTATAIRLARAAQVPVFNLGDPKGRPALLAWLAGWQDALRRHVAR